MHMHFEYKVQPEDKLECHQATDRVVQIFIKTTIGWWLSAPKAGQCERVQRTWHIVAFSRQLFITALPGQKVVKGNHHSMSIAQGILVTTWLYKYIHPEIGSGTFLVLVDPFAAFACRAARLWEKS